MYIAVYSDYMLHRLPTLRDVVEFVDTAEYVDNDSGKKLSRKEIAVKVKAYGLYLSQVGDTDWSCKVVKI